MLGARAPFAASGTAELGDEPAAFTACTLGKTHLGLRLYDLDPRERIVAINGAGRGVGIHAVQVSAAGAPPVALTSSESMEARLRELGADDVVVAPDGPYCRALTWPPEGAAWVHSLRPSLPRRSSSP